MRNIVLILTLILSVSYQSAAQDGDDAYLDSLAELYYSLNDLDTAKLRICDEIAAKHYNVDSTFAWAKRQIKLAQLQHNAFYEAKALVFNSWAYYYIDEYAKANECNFRAIIILDSIGDQALKARNYLMLGDNYHYLNDFKQSTYNYNIALQIFEEIQDSAMIAACYRSLAQSYFMQKLYQQSEEYFQRAIDIDSTTQEYDYLLTDYQGLALMFLTKFLYTDGIDLALAIIDIENNTLHYAGAYRPLWIFSQGTLTAIKPDKMPIGIYAGALKPFTEHTTSIHKGDTLFMFTDGIPDQFGYTDESKTDYKNFSVKQLFNLIGSIAPLPFPQQRAAITSAIDTWQNGYLQLDDITFFALKL